MASIRTTKQRVLNAINLKNQENLYFAIGKSTAWNDEENPDTPLVSQTEIEELIYIKKISVKQLVKLDDPYDVYGTNVTVNGVNYNFVLEGEAYNQNSRMVYLAANINYDDIAPTNTSFRSIGILLNPLDSENEELTGSEYLAATVYNQGQLLYINNFTVITRDPSQSEKIEIVLIF